MQEQQRVLVLGASGLVGKAVTDALLTKGKCAVNGFMRNPGKLGLNHAFLRLIKGDVKDQAALEQALQGCQAVVVAISKDFTQHNTDFTDAAKIISAACIKVGVKRVIQIGGIGIMQTNGQYLFQTPLFAAFDQKYYDVSFDHNGAFEVYKNAGLDITTICPPHVVEKKFTGHYVISVEQIGEDFKKEVGNKDIADFVVKALHDPQYFGQRVGITDKD